MRHDRTDAGIAVAKLPEVGDDGAVGVGARAGVEGGLFADGDTSVGARLGHRRLVDLHRQAVATVSPSPVVEFVGDGESHRVCAGHRVGMGDDRPRGLAAVAKVPCISDDHPVIVEGRRRIEGDRLTDRDRLVGARLGHRRVVDDDGERIVVAAVRNRRVVADLEATVYVPGAA